MLVCSPHSRLFIQLVPCLLFMRLVATRLCFTGAVAVELS